MVDDVGLWVQNGEGFRPGQFEVELDGSPDSLERTLRAKDEI